MKISGKDFTIHYLIQNKKRNPNHEIMTMGACGFESAAEAADAFMSKEPKINKTKVVSVEEREIDWHLREVTEEGSKYRRNC